MHLADLRILSHDDGLASAVLPQVEVSQVFVHAPAPALAYAVLDLHPIMGPGAGCPRQVGGGEDRQAQGASNQRKQQQQQRDNDGWLGKPKSRR